jgi:hypothetical protein
MNLHALLARAAAIVSQLGFLLRLKQRESVGLDAQSDETRFLAEGAVASVCDLHVVGVQICQRDAVFGVAAVAGARECRHWGTTGRGCLVGMGGGG